MLHIFSGNIVHLTFEVAKAMCATDAIFKGILDFIKFGNGQTTPAERCLFREGNMASASPLVCLTLQGYLRHFPTCCWDPLMTRQWLRPMHLVGWMASYNLHMAEGSGISSFRWLTQNLAQCVFFHIDFWVIWYPLCSLPLEFLAHGIVLHLMHPNKVCAYMVKPQFPKHMDAKNVMCLGSFAACDNRCNDWGTMDIMTDAWSLPAGGQTPPLQSGMQDDACNNTCDNTCNDGCMTHVMMVSQWALFYLLAVCWYACIFML